MRTYNSYWLTGKHMRHAKWQESVMRSIAKREKMTVLDITHSVCGCGCGTIAEIIEGTKKHGR